MYGIDADFDIKVDAYFFIFGRAFDTAFLFLTSGLDELGIFEKSS